MPCNYNIYPPNWKTEIRPRILNRANHKCEYCGVGNGAIIRRSKTHPERFILIDKEFTTGEKIWLDMLFTKEIKIILTIAHLDHDPKNWDVHPDRLKALCQRCHFKTHRGLT